MDKHVPTPEVLKIPLAPVPTAATDGVQAIITPFRVKVGKFTKFEAVEYVKIKSNAIYVKVGRLDCELTRLLNHHFHRSKLGKAYAATLMWA